MSVQLNEQETIVSMYRDSDEAEVYTSDTTVITKLDRKVKEFPDVWKCIRVETMGNGAEVVGKWYRCPKKMISFRNTIIQGKACGNTEALMKWRESQKASEKDAL